MYHQRHWDCLTIAMPQARYTYTQGRGAWHTGIQVLTYDHRYASGPKDPGNEGDDHHDQC